MNEKIKKLAIDAVKQSLFEPLLPAFTVGEESNKMSIPFVFVEKFAELLVTECAGIINHRADTCTDQLDSIKANTLVRNVQRECATTICKDFGVEE